MELPNDFYELSLWAEAVSCMSFTLQDALLTGSCEAKAYAMAAWGISNMAQMVQEGIDRLEDEIIAEREEYKALPGNDR